MPMATELQALITGAVAGALTHMSGEAGPFDIAVELGVDEDGNYEPSILVTGRQSGEQIEVTVEAVER
jgi:hypothetical protein